MESMGQARTAEVLRDARIGEAECNRDSLIQTALAEEKRMAAKFSNDTEIEQYKRNFEIKKASYDMEVETARAQSELAFQLQVILFVTFQDGGNETFFSSLYLLGR